MIELFLSLFFSGGRVKVFLRLRTSITCLVLSCFVSLVSLASEAHEVKILAFGDSLTAGYRLPASESYPAQLEQLLNKDGFKVHVTNAGVSGDTTDQALRRVEWSLKQGPYDFVLLCIGANDGLRQLSVKNMEENLTKIVEKFQAKGSKVILMGMQLPVNFSAEYRIGFESAFKRVAAKKSVPYLPFFLEGVAANPSLNLDDQIHPNKRGYEIIAKNVLKFIKPQLD